MTPLAPSDLATHSLSYKNRLANVSGTLINFYLGADSALAAWEYNNDSPGNLGRYLLLGAKPHQFPDGILNTAGYFYHTPASSGEKLRLVREAGIRFLVDKHESMSYVVQSPTYTVGQEGNTRGSIDEYVDLSIYSFGTTHSAQWNYQIQETSGFYSELLVRLGIAVQ